ncbi:hypothetical protein [Actinoplanes sp. ATCC 53533]|uniref:hypothetical protein n=1 Tax=Actinoplanes sp. ATCC 53533 TaxID=1288362 RepID=UPI00272AB4B2|nr:hypothetical protein [Actinoplanes sp. ATCC 53533]
MIGATQLNVRLLRRWPPQQIMGVSLLAGLGFGVGPVAMAIVVFGGMLAATVVCFLVVQPHRLPAEQPQPVASLAHYESACCMTAVDRRR